ncbi:MAG TPA: hypothetical protein VEL51_16610, partial [Vicinamibacterales bacterium]|nr:hypothetical protein [Vicinamibacterales bacterium]
MRDYLVAAPRPRDAAALPRILRKLRCRRDRLFGVPIVDPGQQQSQREAVENSHALRGRSRLSRAMATARASRSASAC